MNDPFLEKIRDYLSEIFGVTLVENRLIVRGEDKIASFIMYDISSWNAEDRCYMCDNPYDLKLHKMTIDGVLETEVNVCVDCRCPK